MPFFDYDHAGAASVRGIRSRGRYEGTHHRTLADGTTWSGGLITGTSGANVTAEFAWCGAPGVRLIPVATLQAGGLDTAPGSPIAVRFSAGGVTALDVAAARHVGNGPAGYQSADGRGVEAFLNAGERDYGVLLPEQLGRRSDFLDGKP
jgi:hypothetical protein